MNLDPILIRQAEIGPMANFIYLVGCGKTREAAVVDPAWDVPEILRLAAESDLRIKHILLTHGHPDHMNGLGPLLEQTDARVHIHQDEVDYMRQAAALYGIDVSFMHRRSANFRAAQGGTEISVGEVPVRFIHTPGHTPGSQCFLVGKNLVSGDTLFVNACGRVDLPGGDPEKLWWSLNRCLTTLDDDTVLYPGHNYSSRNTSTIGDEKKQNPYMQFSRLDLFIEAMRGY